jgi:hypothetical protein
MNRITAIIKAVNELTEMVESAYDQHLDLLLSAGQNSDLELYNQSVSEFDRVDTADLGRLLSALSLWQEGYLD